MPRSVRGIYCILRNSVRGNELKNGPPNNGGPFFLVAPLLSQHAILDGIIVLALPEADFANLGFFFHA